MPQRRNAKKELRKTSKHLSHNLDIKTDLRKTIKKLLLAVKDKNVEEAKATLKLVYKKIDKAAKRHLLHKNTASHRKSRLSKAVLNISK